MLPSFSQIVEGVNNEISVMLAKFKAASFVEYPFDLVASVTAIANTTSQATIVIPGTMGDFVCAGYNIAFTNPTADIPSLSMKITNTSSSRNWSNGFVPVELIATPGVIKAAAMSYRFGERPWSAYVAGGEKLLIEVQNTAAQNCTFKIALRGKILSRVVAQKTIKGI